MTDPEAIIEATGPAPDGTSHVGRDAIRAAWQPIFDDRSATFDAEETFALGDRVVQRWCYRWADHHVRGVDLFLVRRS